MSSSLFTALSGLKAHQQWIDVIGNNLANASTPGFKSSHASFAEAYASTLSPASAPGASFGGKNPAQIGLGVRLADIGRSFTQGALESTGGVFDVALQGGGFFALQGGGRTLYTRVGTFALDAQQNLVDQSSGFRVLDASGAAITLDAEERLPPKATTLLEFVGNLPKVVTGPLPQILKSTNGLKDGDPATITGTATGPFSIPIGETWTLAVRVDGGAARPVSITSTTGSVTAAEIATAIDTLDDVGASVDGTGHVMVTSDRTGTSASLKIDPGVAGRDLASLAGLSTVLAHGVESVVTASTGLNELPNNTADYVDGDSIRISGVDADGTTVSATFTFGAAGDGTRVDELVTFLDGLYANASVSLDTQGRIVVAADTAGESSLALTIADAPTSTGRTQWSTYALSTSQEGTGPDTVTTSMPVFDAAGVSHAVTLTFERQADLTWTLTPSIAEEDGTILSSPISGLNFAGNGAPSGFGSLSSDVIVQFTGQTASQTLALDLGADGSFAGLTQLGGDGDAHVSSQDGYGAGDLSTFSIEKDGVISGFYTNGESRELSNLGIATFANPEGLEMIGDNLFAQSANSGDPSIGAGDAGRAGQVFGGSLESSNVDTAEEFVRLIQAQRGFQANARVISAQDEVLQETVNLI